MVSDEAMKVWKEALSALSPSKLVYEPAKHPAAAAVIEAALTRARNEALEEAAGVADQRAKRANAATDLCPAEFLEEHRAEHSAAMQIATFIRNMKDKGHE